MINHLRTLLINRPATQLRFQPGYEYVDPLYIERTLSDAARRYRDAVFGVRPDAVMLHYRVQQLLRTLETSRLADYIALYDSRRTDWTDRVWGSSVFGQQVLQRLDGENDPIISGTLESPDVYGVCRVDFDITFTTPDTLRIVRLTDPRSDQIQTVSVSQQLTEPKQLPGTNLSVQCPAAENGQWLIRTVARPSSSLQTLLDRMSGISHEATLELFGNTTQEPNRSWWTVWRESESTIDRLAAVTLALGDNINRRRV